MLSLPMGVMRQMIDMPTPPPGAPGPFNLSDSGTLEEALKQAGFTDIRSERLSVSMDFPSAQAYLSMLLDTAAPISVALADKPADQREKVLQATSAAAGQYATADGAIRMENEAICVTGRR